MKSKHEDLHSFMAKLFTKEKVMQIYVLEQEMDFWSLDFGDPEAYEVECQGVVGVNQVPPQGGQYSGAGAVGSPTWL